MNQYIVDNIGTVVAAMRGTYSTTDLEVPYYMFGHRLEISRQLDRKTKNSKAKYPLIALRMDFNETIEDTFIKCKLNIGIFQFTKMNYNTQQRYDNVFKPILYPLYYLFLEELYHSGLFSWGIDGDLEKPKHTKIDRPYWGTPATEKNEKNIFNDPLDAIEIVDMEVVTKIKC